MEYIKEPEGVDFIIAPTTITEKDKEEISTFIANYKKLSVTHMIAEPATDYKKADIKTPKSG